MRKSLIASAVFVSMTLVAAGAAQASPRPASVAACAHPVPAAAISCQAGLPRLLLIRDVRATMGGGHGDGGAGGGGGNANRCWSTCFNTYNACMDKGPKDICVSRMKTCLAICDTSSN